MDVTQNHRPVQDVPWTYSQTGSTAIIGLRGELDLHVVNLVGESVKDAVAGTPVTVIVLDLAGVTFIDSSALGLLVKLNMEAEARGNHLLLGNVPAVVSRILNVSGLEDRFEYVSKMGPKLCPICDHDLAAGAKYGCPSCGARLE